MKSLAVSFILIFLMSGCNLQNKTRPSYLVIAVEDFNADSYICGDADKQYQDGFEIICEDGVRFTHAYTTSTMGQPALTSLLTGLYPQESGVWHNGTNFLSEKITTTAEVALAKEYRTALFSGGAPIWRKSGLSQGFELFDDNVIPNLKELYRPVSKNFELFLNWVKDSVQSDPFYAVIFLPDLQFTESVTINDSGLERAIGFESQLNEINESLATLIQKLKNLKRWNNTFVILTGLNGRNSSTRPNEIKTLNLHSENTQIFLLVKPARNPRDASINWSIDANVTLADVGATLYDLLGSPESLFSYNSKLDVSSLKSAMVKPQVDWNRDRYILTTTAWPLWRGVGGLRTSLRKNSMLLINDQKPEFLNTLSDRFESQPLSTTEMTTRSSILEFKDFLFHLGISPWNKLEDMLTEKLLVMAQLASNSPAQERLRSRLARLEDRGNGADAQITGWLARMAIDEKDWPSLLALGDRHINPIWSYVAKRNMGQEAPAPLDPCWFWLGKGQRPNRAQSNCSDEEFLLFSEWVNEPDLNKKNQIEDKFMRAYALSELDERISRQNFTTGLSWDTMVTVPAEPRMIQLALSLSEYKGYKSIIERRIKRF